MRRFVFLCCAAVLVGCAKPESKPAADTTAAVAPAPPPMISLADVAGKWTVKAMGQTGDSVLVTYDMTATADTSGWMIMLPKRKPMAARVMTSGDSVMVDSGPYESVLRKGVQVTTHGVMRLQGGKLVGTTTAHYATNKPDSVVHLRTEGTRAP